MCGGGLPAPPPAKTLAQIQAETDNPYENRGSGEATPQWKLAVDTTPKKKEATKSESSPRSELYG